MNNQLILKFPSTKAYLAEDYYVSPSNEEAYDFICSWPKWIKRVINIYGPIGSGKTHLISILEKTLDKNFLLVIDFLIRKLLIISTPIPNFFIAF